MFARMQRCLSAVAVISVGLCVAYGMPSALGQGTNVFLNVGTQSPITMLINEGPWYEAFASTVQLYERQTSNIVKLDANPYPAMLSKIRNSTRENVSPYDLFSIDDPWTLELYSQDLLEPLKSLDPTFALDSHVYTYDGAPFWNPRLNWRTSNGGVLMTVPINGNFELFFYRDDLFKQAGIRLPTTWDEMVADCPKLQDPPRVYCYVQRGVGAEGFFNPYLRNYGASIVRDPEHGDFTVLVNSPTAKKALDTYVTLAVKYGPPNEAAINQNDMVQLMAAGKVAAMTNVVAVWSSLEDPNNSNVVGKIATAIPPRSRDGRFASRLGNWEAGIPRNIPSERKRASLAFLKWVLSYGAQYQYAVHGGVPVRSDVYRSDLASRPGFGWMKAYLATAPYSYHDLNYLEAPGVANAEAIRINQAIGGQLSTAKALNLLAEDLYKIFLSTGRRTGKLPPLPE